MRILVTLGDMFGANRLIPVESVQVSGISYKTIGDAGLEFLEAWSAARVVVETWMNPAGMDIKAWKEMGVPESFAEKQLRIIRALEVIGVKQSCTCAPYHAGLVPAAGTHVAWAESSAVCFANSVLGAMTNREGGPSALAAAITGKTPEYGMHLPANRRATHLIEVPFSLSLLDFSLLGYRVGELVRNGIPAFVDLAGTMDAGWNALKMLGAALAAGGGVSMFMIKGITPEFVVRDDAEKIILEREDLEAVREKLTSSSLDSADVIALGCPHCSYEEIVDMLPGIKTTMPVWICTSRNVKERVEREGLAMPGNVKVFADTCMVVAPVKEMGIGTIATDSAKGAHYSRALSGIDTVLDSRARLLGKTKGGDRDG